MKKLTCQKADLLLALTFMVLVALIRYCYPVAEVTWDGDSYIQYSQLLLPNTRPLGYSVFLRILYVFSHSLSFVVYTQFLIYFLSILFLLKVINGYRQLTFSRYYLLGALLLIEPAALYHSITILSDVLFSSLTYLYLGTLLLYIRNKKRGLLIANIFISVLCIEIRHVGLFFPFFTIIFLFIYFRDIKLVLVNTLYILFIFCCVYISGMDWNYKTYGVRIYSPFSGWTEANNALYIVPKIKLDPQTIQDPEIRALQTYFSAFLDTTSFKPSDIGPGYLWDPHSPLHVIRQHVDDSLVKKRGYGDYILTWYLLASRYGKYGDYIMRHFPLEYTMNFLLPNVRTLIKPQNAEMMDYYVAKGGISSESLQKYGLTDSMLYCRQQVYKDHINGINLFFYQLRLVLFLASLVSIFMFRKTFDLSTGRLLFVFCTFIILYYASVLSSSSFTPRILLPALPILTAFIFITAVNILDRSKKEKVSRT